MTIDPETLMAYADGELDPLAMKRIERALAGDPVAAQTVEKHRRLRVALSNEYAGIAAVPAPDRLRALIRPDNVADLLGTKVARMERWPMMRWTTTCSALAASLIVGLIIGHMLTPQARGPMATSGGTLIASGGLAHALNTQLASTQGNDADLRMLVSFRDRSGTLCRVFDGAALNGIACRQDSGWVLRETRAPSAAPDVSGYRQAGSDDAALMADAQDMMAGDPLDAGTEAKARLAGWR